MTLLWALVIGLITLIGAIHAHDLSLEEIDSEYRPWEHNDTSTTWISLSGMGIQSLNSTFRLNIPNLKWLVLDDNQIQTVPSEAFKSFPDLTYVSLAGNQIRQFDSDAFSYPETLRVLDLDRNPITLNNMGYSIFSTLAGLNRLYLRNCHMRSFDLPMHGDNLSHLYLSGNQLQMFYVNTESAITNLYLNSNQFWYVSLSHLKSLIYLDLSNNWLTRIVRQSEFPSTYFARNFQRRGHYDNRDYYQREYGSRDDSNLYLDDASVLQHLIVSSNLLLAINPDTFQDSKALIYVDLSDNRIGEVYAGTFNDLPKLETILLDTNRIRQINHRAFVNLPNLKTISLKNNMIDDLDEDAFTKLNSSANEVYLFLDNNQIHTLRRGSFRGITGLKHIGLSGNKIMTISSEAFINLPNLESIEIENQSRDQNIDCSRSYCDELSILRMRMTRKGSIEANAFFNLSNLASITIRGNSFDSIEAQAFHKLPKLTILDLSNNSIHALPSEAFDDLPALENLNLGNNLISKIEPETFPKQLKHLNLTSNLVCPNFSCWNVEELYQLETLDVSGIIEQFTIEDFTDLPRNLTVIVKKTRPIPDLQVPCQ